ncbi:DUF4132 domain-containing protein [Luteimonas sp. SJ-92]|uniref:DUF4132 domain-containing protein n=1 Tax=Luteimonas salinisoli TaxID=2752307 RepID=A0A853J8K5_9GAMM|nr:DUF4132 domain-containing protein [Luteimonas salinisoli]NZA25471.1 DUF4132 domain-containing protein [Luteimonas salinisoli]
MRRFEFSEGTSNKFWEIELDGSDVNIRWGRIGTQGQSQTKTFGDDAKAAAAMTKLIDAKAGKGYAEVAAAADAGIGKTETKVGPSVGNDAATTGTVAVAKPIEAPSDTVPPATAAVAIRANAPTVAPWLLQGEPLDVPAGLLARALPSRRFPAVVAPGGDPAAVLQALYEAIDGYASPDDKNSDASMAQALQQGWERLQKPAAKASPHADAAMLALVFAAAPNAYRATIDVRSLVNMLVGRDGLPAALDLLLQAEREFEVRFEWRGTNGKPGISFHDSIDGPLASRWSSPVGEGEWAFRRHLSAASDSVYSECVDRIRAALPTLHPSRQVAMAMLLPDEPQVSNALAFALAGPNAPSALHWLQLTATDPAALAAIRRTKLDAYGQDILDDPEMVATLLQERGMGALETLLARAEGEVAGTALAAFGLPEAIDALARSASSSKGALARLTAAVNRWPLAAIVALSKLVAGGSKEGALVAPSLTGLLRANEAALPALRPWLGTAAEAVVDRMLKQLSGPSVVGSTDELPAVLARPPWLATRKKRAIAALDLETLPIAPVERWAPGEREAGRFAAGQLPPYYADAAKDPDKMVECLDFKRHVDTRDLVEPAIRAIRTQDATALCELWLKMKQARKAERWSYITLSDTLLALLPGEMGASVWNVLAGESDYSYRPDFIVGKFGLKVLPGLLAVVRRHPAENLVLALNFGAVDLAPQMARAAAKLKSLRETGRQWLLKFPEHAACGLIAAAVGKRGEARDCAGVALRILASEGHGALVLEVAARYGQPEVVAAVEAVLAEDPLDRFPRKRPTLPAFWQPGAWRRPVLAEGPGAGKALPDEALAPLGTMLAFPTNEGIYPGIEQVRDACTRDSLADFAWDCFAAWLYAGAPSKDGWALTALGLFGNDETARKLTPYLRAWPGEAAHARAVAGLDVLAMIGSDVALMLLNGIAQKVKFKGLQDRAREKIAQIAEARGFTTEELEDRLAPDLGLDEHGTMLLDFGPRAFRVGFDEALKPYVRDGDGARLADLPKPKKTDDAGLSKEAAERFKLLKKDVRTIASQQVLRLEVAMCTRRRWRADVFRAFLAEHPLVRHLVQRLVWGVYEVDAGQGDGSYGGRLRTCFRVAEDGGFTTGTDDPFELPQDEALRVGIPHALELGADVAAEFGQLFTDYELLQPFAQLGRDTHVLTPDEQAQQKLVRWKGSTVPTGRVLGLVNKGWRRGQAQDGGGIWYFNKPLGRDRAIELSFEPGIIVGLVDEYPEQTLLEVQVGQPSGWGEIQNGEPLSSLDPIAASELIRDLESLRA